MVVHLPATGQTYQSVWHFLAYLEDKSSIKVFSVPKSTSILFDTSYLPATQQNYIPLVTKFAVQDAKNIRNLTATLYYQNEEFVNEEGVALSLKKGGNLMVAFSADFLPYNANQTAACIDLEVGIDGYFAGTSSDRMGVKTDIACAPLSYYGTAIELDGEEDRLFTNWLDLGSNTHTLEIGGWFKSNSSSKQIGWSNLITIGTETQYLYLNIDQQGQLYLSDDRTGTNQHKCDNVPLMEANRWTFVKLSLYMKGDNKYHLALGTTQQNNVSQQEIMIDTFDFTHVYFHLGGSRGVIQGFAGQIAAASYTTASSTTFSSLNPETVVNFSEGSGSSAGQFYISGAKWVSAVVPTQEGMQLQFFDNKLLTVRTAMLGVAVPDAQSLQQSVQVSGTMSLLDAKDGLLKLFYPRASDQQVGVAHFDPSVYRAQQLYYWETDDADDLLLPNLMFTALSPGAVMNDFELWLNGESGKYTLEVSCQSLPYENGTKLTIVESWKNIPAVVDEEKQVFLTVHQLAAIINGTSEFYDYTNASKRISATDEEVYAKNPIDAVLLNQPGSILVQVDVLSKNDEDVLESLPPTLADIYTTFNGGLDSNWVLDPLLPILQLTERETHFEAEKNYQNILPGNFTIEKWIRNYDLNGDSYSAVMGLPEASFATNSLVSIVADNSLLINIEPNESNGQALSYQTESATLQANQWQHLAIAYETGYALQFNNQNYVEIKHDASIKPREAFTVEAWYYQPAGSPQDQILLSKWGEKADDQSWILGTSQKTTYFKIMDEELVEETFINIESGSCLDNTWNHIGASYTPAQTHNLLHFIKEDENNGYVLIDGLSKTLPDTLTVEFKVAVSLENDDSSRLVALGYPKSSNENDFKNILTFSCSSAQELEIRFFNNKFSFDDSHSFKFVNNQLAHFSFIFEKTEEQIELKLYVDGLAIGTGTVSSETYKNDWEDYFESMQAAGQSLKWILGASFDSNSDDNLDHNHFSGYFGELRVWDICRTKQQIIDYSNVTVQPNANGLLGLFVMNQSPFVNATPSQGSEIYITNQVTDINYFAASSKNIFWDTLSSPVRAVVVINGSNNEYLPEEISKPIQQNKTPIYFGKLAEQNPQLVGKLDNVRMWRQERTVAQIDYYQIHDLAKSIKEERNVGAYAHLIAAWGFDEGKGKIIHDSVGKLEGQIKGVILKNDETAASIWVPSTFNAALKVYIDGNYVPPRDGSNSVEPNFPTCTNLTIFASNQSFGDLRLWSPVHTQAAIRKSRNRRLVGNEANLVGYWSITDGINSNIIDQSQYRANGSVNSDNTHWIFPEDSSYYPIPISKDPMLCVNVSNDVHFAESEDVAVEGGVTATEFNGFKELFLGFVNTKAEQQELALSIDEHPEEPVLVYIGQAQYDAKIVGFIEGAPPVPSENLSVDTNTTPDKYVGTAKVSLTSEGSVQTTHSLNLGLDMNLGLSGELGLAAEASVSVAAGVILAEVETQILDLEGYGGVELAGNIAGSVEDERQESIQNSKNVHYELDLCGSWENNIYNLAKVAADKLYIQAPRIYRPNNMGVAVVKSRTADLYALQDPKTGRTISYEFKVDPNIPEDVNYILFEINPAYLKNGSLDGRIGYDTDVAYPALENNPHAKASFFKAQEAYQLEAKINRQQKEWQNTLKQTFGGKQDAQSRAKGISLVNNYVWTADGGLMSDSKQLSVAHQEEHEIVGDINGALSGNYEGKMIAGPAMMVGPKYKLNGTLGGGLTVSYTNDKSSEATFQLEVEVEGEGFLSMQADMSPQAAISIVADNEAQYTANLESLNQGYAAGNLPSTNSSFHTALVNAEIIPKKGTTKYLVKCTGIDNWEWQSASTTYLVTTDAEELTIYFTPRNTARSNEYPIRYQANNCPGKVKGYRFKTFYLKPDKENFNILKDGYESDVPLINPDWLNNPDNPDAVALQEALQKTNRI
ncbi:MAG: LamG-like jellyroll fold domain-containing protein [Saprospiraceae bacterium]